MSLVHFTFSSSRQTLLATLHRALSRLPSLGPAGNIISTSTINIDFWFRHADFIDASPVGGFTVGRDTNYWGKVTGWEWNKKEFCNSGITAAGTLQTLLGNMVCKAVLFYSAQLNFLNDYYGCHQSFLHCIHYLFLN